jgi:hypothetical protein
MSHEARTRSVETLRFPLSIVEKILPRAIQPKYMSDLREMRGPVRLKQILLMVVGGYRNQAVLAFDVLSMALYAAGAAYCFAAASFDLPFVIALGSTLGPLLLRTAYTHPFSRDGDTVVLSTPLDSLGDSVISVVVLLLSQTAMLKISLSLTLPPTMLGRSIFIYFPLMAVLRTVLRPRPDPRMPFQGSKLTTEQICRRTWCANIVWIFACLWTMVANPHSLPNLLPQSNLLRNFFSMLVFGVWFRLRQNALTRRDYIETLFTDWEKKKLARHRELLMTDMTEKDPYYWLDGPLQGVLFIYLAVPLAFAIWPWLSGAETHLDVFGLTFQAVALFTVTLSWTYLKDANRAAAAALEAAIKSSAPLPKRSDSIYRRAISRLVRLSSGIRQPKRRGNGHKKAQNSQNAFVSSVQLVGARNSNSMKENQHAIGNNSSQESQGGQTGSQGHISETYSRINREECKHRATSHD